MYSRLTLKHLGTLLFCPPMQVVPLGWPSDLFPAFPSSPDHGHKCFSPQLVVDWITVTYRAILRQCSTFPPCRSNTDFVALWTNSMYSTKGERERPQEGNQKLYTICTLKVLSKAFDYQKHWGAKFVQAGPGFVHVGQDCDTHSCCQASRYAFNWQLVAVACKYTQ